MNFSNIVIATAQPFASGTPDKNGLDPIILNVVAGKFPNRNVMSGSVACGQKAMEDPTAPHLVEVGKTYLFQCREIESSEEHGRQFVWNPLKELGAMEIVEASLKIGPARMFDVLSEDSTVVTTETRQVEAEV